MIVGRTVCVYLCAASLAANAGCASVMSGRHAQVAFNSNPEHAHVVVKNRHGETVAESTTPTVVSLKRGDGFLRPARYTATIESPGYETTKVAIDPKMNPWVFGNVLFGGLIGVFVDPVTGAMWNLTPNEVNHELVAIEPTSDTMVR